MDANVVSWIGVGLTAIGLTGGAIAYAHVLTRGSEATMRGELKDQKEELKEMITSERAERLAGDSTERDERRREHDRLEAAVASFQTVSTVVTTIAEGLRHLGERFDDQRTMTNDSLGEIKHSVRNLDAKFSALPGASTAARRARKMREE